MSTDANTVLELTGVHTRIGAYHILHGVNLAVREGEVTMLLGRNGAGKTTTLRTIMGLWAASQGDVRFQGQSIKGLPTPDVAARGIAYVPESMGIFTDLTVQENLVLAARAARHAGELDAAQGGGAVYSQAAHQIDVVRHLAGGCARSLRATAGAWDAARRIDGAYAAFMTFGEGVAATLTYSGYAHFDSDELCGWTGEMGHAKDRARHSGARAAVGAAGTAAEAALRQARMYGATGAVAGPPAAHPQFGLVIASCEGADLRPGPHGVTIYDDGGERLDALPPPALPRAEVVDELCDAAAGTRAAVHTGEWGRATLEACLAILASTRENREIALERQVALTGET